MSRIVAVATALPPNAYPQSEITEMITPMVTANSSRQAVMRRMHASSRVDTRYLVQELSGYRVSQTFTETNGIFIDVATNLAEEALGKALTASGVTAADIDFIVFTSVTGISAPSIDALLVPRLGLRTNVKRVPMFGLGCVAGAAGLARVHDYLLGHPNEVAVLISVELCSLTVQKDDDSMANIVASGLFGDGAAAVVVLGDERARSMPGLGIDIVDTRSRLYADTNDVLGFNPGETGFKIVLTAGVAGVIEQNFGADMAGFLGDNGLVIDDIGAWVAHPGGPRVLEAFSESLDLPEGSLSLSWESLARVGNLSSASVLHILADTIAEGRALPGQYGMLFALGPGVCAELVLLQWAQNEEVAA